MLLQANSDTYIGMYSIDQETDIERLREIARVLLRENEVLHQRLQKLSHDLLDARGETRLQLELELKLVKEQLDRRNQSLFGVSSEKHPSDSSQPAARTSKTPRQGHGPRSQPSLPLVEKVHELDEADRACPQCGGRLAPFDGQFEESEEIDIVEREFRIVRHKRQKYTCKCSSCVETALGPTKLVPGGRYSVDFAAAVAIGKYADHLPLARQVKQMRRQGLDVTSQTLWDQLHALHSLLRPTHDALLLHLLGRDVLGADETTWSLMKKGARKTWYVWAVSGDDAIYYRILGSRSHNAAAKLLASYGGILVVDGYAAYAKLRDVQGEKRRQLLLDDGEAESRAGPVFTLAYCWAHVRRKFVECGRHYPEAEEALDLIGRLYGIEREACEGDPGGLLERRRKLRAKKSAALLDELRRWAAKQRTLPTGGLGRAIAYMLGHWDGLLRFLDDPRVPLDNNATERGIRAPVVGRKNHYGSRSERGTEVAGLFYSLIESARLVGLEPAEYLAEATRRALANPGTVTLPVDLVTERATTAA